MSSQMVTKVHLVDLAEGAFTQASDLTGSPFSLLSGGAFSQVFVPAGFVRARVDRALARHDSQPAFDRLRDGSVGHGQGDPHFRGTRREGQRERGCVREREI